MNSEQQKLAIIEKVIQCQDEQLLQTVLRMLQTLVAPNSREFSVSPAMINSILEQPAAPTTTERAVSQIEIEELQGEVDDIFGP